MTDITAIGSIPDGTGLSDAQLQGMIDQIDLNIYNLVKDGKHATLPYTKFGDVGHKADPAQAIKALQDLRTHYKTLMEESPAEEMTLFDNPGF
jgi:hypothetical protein